MSRDVIVQVFHPKSQRVVASIQRVRTTALIADDRSKIRRRVGVEFELVQRGNQIRRVTAGRTAQRRKTPAVTNAIDRVIIGIRLIVVRVPDLPSPLQRRLGCQIDVGKPQ